MKITVGKVEEMFGFSLDVLEWIVWILKKSSRKHYSYNVIKFLCIKMMNIIC